MSGARRSGGAKPGAEQGEAEVRSPERSRAERIPRSGWTPSGLDNPAAKRSKFFDFSWFARSKRARTL